MKNIYLVGFMGTGKTVVGEFLAKKLKLKFIDLDDMIEKKEGAKISEIFKQKGEPYFRKVEKQAVQDICRKINLVVGCGGGAVLDKDNLDNLKKTGTVICLEAGSEVILKRTSGSSKRPLLNVSDPKKKIEELLLARAHFYNQAHFIIDTSDLNIEEVAQKILNLIESS